MIAMRHMLVGAAALAMFVIVGCFRLGSGAPSGSVHPGDIPPGDFTVRALPVYRLVSSPVLIDSPSRLLVVSLRLEATGDPSYAYTASDLHIVLPDGSRARIFDHPRALELLRRAIITEADMSYLLRPGHQPGGISEFTRSALADMVAGNLLDAGAFASGRPLQGYVVIDTGVALMSIEGASFEVVARRLGDDAPARYAYRLQPATSVETQ